MTPVNERDREGTPTEALQRAGIEGRQRIRQVNTGAIIGIVISSSS
jgi:hypothetical protein